MEHKSGSYGGGLEVLIICSINQKSDRYAPMTTKAQIDSLLDRRN